MLKIKILICAVGISHVACNSKNADDVVCLKTVDTIQQRAFMGMSTIAPGNQLQVDPSKQYIKVTCERYRHPINEAHNGAIIAAWAD